MIVIFIPPKVINIPHLPKFLPTFFHLHLLKNLNEVTAVRDGEFSLCRGGFKEVVHRHFTLHKGTVKVVTHTICGDKGMLNGFTRLGYGLKYSNPISEFFLIIGTNAIFSVGKFHFTEINHIITPIDKKVDLGTAPLISIFVGKCLARPRVDITQHSTDA